MASNKEMVDYFRMMEELFGTEGWRYIEDDAKRQIYQYQCDALDKTVSKSWEDVCILRGKAEQLAEIVALRDMIRTQLNALTEDGDANS